MADFVPTYLLLPLRRRDGTLRGHAIIDAADAHLAEFRWHQHNMGYAVRNIEGDAVELLHRAVAGCAPGDGTQVDHINRDKLDCRRANLRVGTHALNAQNVPGQPNRTSRHRNVSWEAKRQRWFVSVRLDGRERFVGRFDDEDEAAEAARAWRREHMPFAVEA